MSYRYIICSSTVILLNIVPNVIHLYLSVAVPLGSRTGPYWKTVFTDCFTLYKYILRKINNKINKYKYVGLPTGGCSVGVMAAHRVAVEDGLVSRRLRQQVVVHQGVPEDVDERVEGQGEKEVLVKSHPVLLVQISEAKGGDRRTTRAPN